MKIRLNYAVVPLACLSMAACKFGGGDDKKAPTGQVVATVNGEEITMRELNLEMVGANIPDANAMKSAQEQTLQKMIERKVLAQAAKTQGLDKTPDYALEKSRASEALLAQALQTKLVKDVPKPAAEEIQRFITDHPNSFSERKIFTVEQVQMARPNADMAKDLIPMKTMDSVLAYLTEKKVPFKHDSGPMDAVGQDPRLVDAIEKLPKGEIFIIPVNGGITVNAVRDEKTQPFSGPGATDFATQVLTREHVQQTVSNAFQNYMKTAAPKIQVNKAFVPPKSAPNPLGPAPAAAAGNKAGG